MTDALDPLDLDLAALVPVQEHPAPPAAAPSQPPEQGTDDRPLIYRGCMTTSEKKVERCGQATSITHFILERDGEPVRVFIGSEEIRENVEAIVNPTTPVIYRGQVGPRGLWFGYPDTQSAR